MKIKAKNFLSWENLEFDVKKGVTLITGFNHDDGTPEGSGKSAILNALCFGFFGKIPKDALVDEVVREGTSNCEVEIIHDDFTIFRGRKPNDLYLKKEGKIIRGKNSNETQEKIEKELGMSFETFCQSIYFAQNYPNKFVTANQANKGKILSELLDLEQFDRARDAAAKKAKPAKEALAAAIKDVERFEAILTENEKSTKNLDELIAEFQSQKVTRIQGLVKQLQGIETDAEAFVEQFEADKAEDLTNCDIQIKSLKKDLKAKKLALSELEAALDQFDNAGCEASYNALEGQSATVEESRTAAKVKLAGLENEFKAQEKREKDLKRATSDLADVLNNHQELVEETKERETDVANLLEEVLKTEAALKNPKKGDCPTCGQAWDGDKSHYEKEFQKASKDYKRAQDALTANQRGIKQFQDQADNLNEVINALKQEIGAFEAPTTAKLEKKIASLTEELESLKTQMRELQKASQEYEKTEIKFESLQKEVLTAQKSLDKQVKDREAIEAATPVKQLEAFQKRQTELMEELTAEDAKEPTMLEQKLAKAKADVKKNSEELNKAQQTKAARELELIRLEALRDGYREVKAYTFNNVLAQLTKKANNYLAELYEQPVKILFKNIDMEIDVQVTINGKTRSLGLFSGGQGRRIHLAVDLALSDITMSRKGNKLPFMIMDEYCKDLSEVSMEKILKLLQARKGSTLLIEHNSIFKSIVNQTFDVEYINGVSRRAA